MIHYQARTFTARNYFKDAIKNGKWVTDKCPEEFKRHKNEVLEKLDMHDLIEEII